MAEWIERCLEAQGSYFSTNRSAPSNGIFIADNVTSALCSMDIDNTTLSATSEKKNSYQEVGLAMIRYLLPVILFAGSVGNVLSFAVLLRRKMRRTSVFFYLACLACADMLVLYVSAFKTWVRVVFGFELLHLSGIGCRLIMFLFLLSLHMSAWIIVLVALDRTVVVWFPFQALSLCSVRRARCFILILFALTVGTNLHVFWTFNLHHTDAPSNTSQPFCAPYQDNTFMVNSFDYLKLVSYSMLPFSLVLILNISIIVRMLHTNKTRDKHLQNGCQTGRPRYQTNQQRVTCMLLVITFSWLVLTAPFTLHSLLASPSPDPTQNAITFLSKTICFLLMYLNHSINFYLYCITGTKFRSELRHMFAVGRVQGSFNTRAASVTQRTAFDPQRSHFMRMTATRNFTAVSSPRKIQETIFTRNRHDCQ